MAVNVAEEWLNICGGCEVTILDIGEPLLDLLPQLNFVHMPVLMDHKYFGQTGEGTEMEIPEADVGIISGGVRTEKEKKVAEEMRKKCKTLIALGSCACYGGIPAMANMSSLEDMYEKVFRGSKTTDAAETPSPFYSLRQGMGSRAAHVEVRVIPAEKSHSARFRLPSGGVRWPRSESS